MSIYSSKALSRRKAMQIVSEAMGNDEDLKDLVNAVLEKHTFRNCYRIVGDGQENDDEDDGLTGWQERQVVHR